MAVYAIGSKTSDEMGIIQIKGTIDMREDEIISDLEIERVHAHANFGDIDKRDIVRESVLKVASGLHIGYTAQTIVFEHGLVDSTDRRPTLTDLGRKYLWASMKQHVK